MDTSDFPADVLLIRGEASVAVLDDVAPEYEQAARRYLGDTAEDWVSRLRGRPMARVTARPTWAEVHDFRTRFPQSLSS